LLIAATPSHATLILQSVAAQFTDVNGAGEPFGSTSIVSSTNEFEFAFPSADAPGAHTNEADFDYLSLPPSGGDPISLFLRFYQNGRIGIVTWQFTGFNWGMSGKIPPTGVVAVNPGGVNSNHHISRWPNVDDCSEHNGI
jgi:hypothetical protein